MPVIFLSVYGQDEVIARAFDMGAADYVVKPFSPTELAARIRAALRRRALPERPEPSEPHVVGELSVDFAQRRATLGGSPVRLTTLEHRLLVELALYAGEPVTYEHLLERIWGPAQLRRPAAGAHRGEEPAPEAWRRGRQPGLRLHRARRLLSEGLAVGLLPLADAEIRHQEWGFRRVSDRGVV